MIPSVRPSATATPFAALKKRTGSPIRPAAAASRPASCRTAIAVSMRDDQPVERVVQRRDVDSPPHAVVAGNVGIHGQHARDEVKVRTVVGEVGEHHQRDVCTRPPRRGQPLLLV